MSARKQAKRAKFYNRERAWRKSRQAMRVLVPALLSCLTTPDVNWWSLQ